MDELLSSELGTKEYWTEAYKKEIINFDEHGDVGDVWFGEDSVLRVINWISKCGLSSDTRIIDLGCGNGYSLMELAREGFSNLLGVDYCEEALTLAKRVSVQEFPNIRYQLFDITKDDVSNLPLPFDLVHDKGTYDAISLTDDSKSQRSLYIERVCQLLDDNGIFVITSCNWTEEELGQQFSGRLKLKCVIPTPQFKFGGKVGGVVSSIVFCKNKNV